MTGFFLDYQVPGERELSDVAASLREVRVGATLGFFWLSFLNAFVTYNKSKA